MELKIDEELKNIIAPLTKEEFEVLEESIKEEGCRDSLIVWDGIIVDGHNRYNICTKHDIDFDVKEVSFKNKTEAKIWMIKNQFGRRNLTNYQRSELALRLEDEIAARAKENKRKAGKNHKGNQHTGVEVLSNSTEAPNPINTREELADEAGVSSNTIYRSKKINEHADDETKEKVKSGEWSVNRGFQVTRIKLEGREDLLRKANEGDMTWGEAYKEAIAGNKKDDKTENIKEEIKVCLTCGVEKNINEFYNNNNSCKKCLVDKRSFGVTVSAEEEERIKKSLEEESKEPDYSSKIIGQLADDTQIILGQLDKYAYMKKDLKNLVKKDKNKVNDLMVKIESKIKNIKTLIGGFNNEN